MAQLAAEHRPKPKDPTLFTFSFIYTYLSAKGAIRAFLNVLSSASLIVLTPYIPLFPLKNTRRAFLWAYGIAFFFCYVVTRMLTLRYGTYQGSDPNRMYFVDDLSNRINYLFVSPANVGLSIALMIIVANCWAEMYTPASLTMPSNANVPRCSVGFTVLLVLFVGIASTLNFMRECISPDFYPKVGWWVERVSSDGTRNLGVVGVYYGLLNFGLIIICCFGLVSFISLLYLCIRFGLLISSQPVTSAVDFATVQKALSAFTSAYVVLKLWALVLILNVWTWHRYLRPSASLNFVLFNALILVVAVFLISVPRYCIELEWFWYRVRRAKACGESDNLEADDCRSAKTRLFAHLVDGVVISGFIATSSGYIVSYFMHR
jgi:hypothetical protein